jgi:3-keto-5-aminohexanoate cleavage enzyme
MKPLIITVAPIGAEVTKEDNPNLPITPEEMAEEAYNCYKEGASIIHLHARDKDGNPTQNPEIYNEMIKLIKERYNIIIQISTGGAIGMSPEERRAPLKLKPEMASLTTGTVNFGDSVFYNPPTLIKSLAQEMKNLKIKPEMEIFDVGMIANAKNLIKEALIASPFQFGLIMGVPGGIPGTIKDLIHLVESLPEKSMWSATGIGKTHLPISVTSIALGGNVRLGFEDNIYYKKGVLAESNAQLVKRIVRIAKEMGRKIATPEEARKLLGLEI